MSTLLARGQVEQDCPSCHRVRWISPERSRRIEQGKATPLCRSCKGTPMESLSAALPKADHSDADLRWWIQLYGGEIGPRDEPRGWVRANGMPAQLDALVASLRP